MRHRRLALLLAAAAVAVLAGAGCGSRAPAAVRVDDESISRRDFEDSLDVVYENEGLLGFLFQGATRDQVRGEDAPRGSYPQNYVGALAAVQAQFLVAPLIADREGLEITDGDRQSVADLIDREAPDALDDLPEPVRDSYIDGLAAIQVIQDQVDPDEVQSVFTDGFRQASVDVSSRYGTWNPDELSVDPPPGPRPAPGSGDTGAGSDLPAG